MEPDRAIEIVQALADGVDPYSGDRFPSGSPYQQADTVRALHLALEGLTKLRRAWTEDEEREFLREFDDKLDVEEIAAKHERTKGAIWARLEKLGRDNGFSLPGTDYAVQYSYDSFGRFQSVTTARSMRPLSEKSGETFSYTYLPGTSLLSGMNATSGRDI